MYPPDTRDLDARRADGLTTSTMIRAARAIRNPVAAPAEVAYGISRAAVLDRAGFAEARSVIRSWPGYTPTPLVALPDLARALGVGSLWYKDEGGRFGLGSFKALGGAYAVGQLLRRRSGAPDLPLTWPPAAALAAAARETTVTCATDGNHGRSVAWGAQLFGCRCVIFVHEHVSAGRRQAIERLGAEVRVVPGDYDAAVRHAAATAAEHGWTVVSDTSYPGYRDIPRDVMHGYGVLAAEIAEQLPAGERPSHLLVQSGVGALAAALCAWFWIEWEAARPSFVAIEPWRADCLLRSLEHGSPVPVAGAHDTVMAGLACGEVSELAWEILHHGTNSALAFADVYAVEAMRRLAAPEGDASAIVAGETGGSGIAALLAASEHADVRRILELDATARVLVIGSEADTDPEIYARIVGRTAAEVRAAVPSRERG